jgi:hypothetical protein
MTYVVILSLDKYLYACVYIYRNFFFLLPSLKIRILELYVRLIKRSFFILSILDCRPTTRCTEAHTHLVQSYTQLT